MILFSQLSRFESSALHQQRAFFSEMWSLLAEDEFLILGTDGLWEFVSNEDAVNFVRSAG